MNVRCRTYFEILKSSRQTVQATINRRRIEIAEYSQLPFALRSNFIQVLFDRLQSAVIHIVSNQWSSISEHIT